MKSGILLALGLTLLTCAFARAETPFAKTCAKDLKKIECKAKNDQQIHDCLAKHEDSILPHNGFSKPCYEADEEFVEAKQKKE